MRYLLLALVLLNPLVCVAQQKLLPAQSAITFVSKQMGVPVEGHFKKFDAQIKFDPKKLSTSKITFDIDLTSASMGSPEAEAELRNPGWFNSLKIPQAHFASTAFKNLGAGKFEITGKLSIKGVSKDLVVPATLTQTGSNTTAVGTFVIKRIDFKIGEGEWNDTSIVANDVQVKFKLGLTGVASL